MKIEEKTKFKNQTKLYYSNEINKLENHEPKLPQETINRFKQMLIEQMTKSLKDIDNL